jgi:hypothetical protein
MHILYVSVFPTVPILLSFLSFCLLPPVCGHQALERQKELFDCIRDELADIKVKAKTGEVGLTTRGLGIVYIPIE